MTRRSTAWTPKRIVDACDRGAILCCGLLKTKSRRASSRYYWLEGGSGASSKWTGMTILKTEHAELAISSGMVEPAGDGIAGDTQTWRSSR